ncbi:mycofactocin-coupled SDR family oxidoreductase [Saccharopolyspora sp. TS4A08]|uniref:Mycofactocin-coupled SDR family oxidoreductase n=2 Tax=Saccharopolyspora ipomoeae TaxID=3042027 RepID=A0ABT6PQ93_9PSEU|nr:mycofactocin-coupled SDR family oxidoreductase [Saccharopolyspora sp. TS4A08]MDI2030183.1 mycofactocin-coupled SDR family oxidoreductase [Saccharopolyspora sp. TS4A08]
MGGKLEGKVAFITGAARGQGRSHAIRLAEEGADIIALDLVEQMPRVPYDMATPEDFEKTVAAVEGLGRRIVTGVADVRDRAAVRAVVDDGVAEFGRIDVVLANAGIAPHSAEERDAAAVFDDVIAVNLAGVYNTVHAAVPTMIERGEGGSVVLTSSIQGLSGRAGTGTGSWDGYAAAKHGVVGLMRSWANWLAQYSIRVNSVHPTGVNTPMIVNESLPAFFEKFPDSAVSLTNLLPVEMVEPVDVSNAIAWLVSDEARYVTGVTLPVDAGFTVK